MNKTATHQLPEQGLFSRTPVIALAVIALGAALLTVFGILVIIGSAFLPDANHPALRAA